MIVIGLTGSIGMGKSTVASLFVEEGATLYEADMEVHKLYYEREIIEKIKKTFPKVIDDGKINRKKLSSVVFEDSKKLRLLEEIVHPYIRKREKEFLRKVQKDGKKIVVLDIPLLLEKRGEDRVDVIVVVSASFEIQKKRVLGRPNMTEKKFLKILSHQMNEKERQKKADFILDSSKSFDQMRADIHVLMSELLEKHVKLIKKERKVNHA